MTKEEMIGFIMSSGGARALYELLMGTSEFSQRGGDQSRIEPSIEETRLVGAARSHLDFVARFGRHERHVIVGEKHYFAYPEKFEDWIRAGAPGVREGELRHLCESLGPGLGDG